MAAQSNSGDGMLQSLAVYPLLGRNACFPTHLRAVWRGRSSLAMLFWIQRMLRICSLNGCERIGADQMSRSTVQSLQALAYGDAGHLR